MERLEISEGDIILDGTLDSDGELEISLMVGMQDIDRAEKWIDKTGAIKIIEHLKAVFEISS